MCPFLTNESIMELDAVPEHLIVIGGGYIGLEFGQMFRRFGSRVTVIHIGKQLLEHEDADVAEEVKKILTEDGIEFLLETKTTAARKSGDAIELTVKVAGESRTVSGSHLLVAAGRTPNTDALNLPAAGVAGRRTTATSRSTSISKPTSPASTPWETSRAVPPSPTSPTTTTASSRPISSTANTAASATASCPTPSSSTRSSAASALPNPKPASRA